MIYFISARGGNQIHKTSETEVSEIQVSINTAECTKRKMTGYLYTEEDIQTAEGVKCPKCFN